MVKKLRKLSHIYIGVNIIEVKIRILFILKDYQNLAQAHTMAVIMVGV